MFLIEAPDGSEQCRVKSLDGYPGWTVLYENAELPYECPYLNCGPAHIDRMHQKKWAEALLVEAGVELTQGLLFHEARVTGETIQSLAAKVIAHNLGPVVFETNRRAAKVEARAKGEAV